MKGTRKWKSTVKIQAMFRGYAFRTKRKKALQRLNENPKHDAKAEDGLDEFDLLAADDDFDAEAFLDVK